MRDGRCTKHYPKEYCDATIWKEGDLHPTYRRRSPTQELSRLSEPYTSRGVACHIDSKDVVPYNPYLTLRFGSHINVEACNSVKATKCLFKYVYKGHDKGRAMPARTTDADNPERNRDEVAAYEDCRVIGASEACWRLYAFLMSTCLPPVLSIPVHLENGQRVVFDEAHIRAAALARPTRTPLTEWFAVNSALRVDEPKYL